MVVRIDRAQIKNAAYNPRRISEENRARLKGVIEDFGLLEPLVWNRRTGNLVGGHQRLSLLDQLHGGAPYALDVSQVDLALERERRANVVLNNPNLQGEYENELLARMALEGTDLTKAGFDRLELQIKLDGTDAAHLFAPPEPPEVADDIDTLAAMGEARGVLANGEPIRDPEAHERTKAHRDEAKKKIDAYNDANRADFVVTVVCNNGEQRSAVMRALGKPDAEWMVSASALLARLRS